MLESKTLVLLPHRATTTDLDRFRDFDCGDEDYQRELVDFLLGPALGEARSRYNTTYVFYDDLERPLAFVALACSSIDAWCEASANAGNVPVLLIEMLAVDRRNQRCGGVSQPARCPPTLSLREKSRQNQADRKRCQHHTRLSKRK